VRWVVNLTKGRAFGNPKMEMNDHSLNRFMSILADAGVVGTFAGFSDCGGHPGVMIGFQRRVDLLLAIDHPFNHARPPAKP
jgi:hypothetical protein